MSEQLGTHRKKIMGFILYHKRQVSTCQAKNLSVVALRLVALCLSAFYWVGVSSYAAEEVSEDGGKKRQVSGAKDEGDYVVEKRKDGTIVKYKKKNVYDFEGYNVDGLYNKPSGSYISNIKDVKAKTIIRIRKHFDEEVIDSARMVQ